MSFEVRVGAGSADDLLSEVEDKKGAPSLDKLDLSAPGKKGAIDPAPPTAAIFCPIAPNRLAERPEPPTRPNEVWQADITYVAAKEGWLCLAGVLDACSRRIVGWAADEAMPTALVARAFFARRPGAAARLRVAPPFRSRQPVCQRRLPRTLAPSWRDCEHEPKGQLL